MSANNETPPFQEIEMHTMSGPRDWISRRSVIILLVPISLVLVALMNSEYPASGLSRDSPDGKFRCEITASPYKGTSVIRAVVLTLPESRELLRVQMTAPANTDFPRSARDGSMRIEWGANGTVSIYGFEGRLAQLWLPKHN